MPPKAKRQKLTKTETALLAALRPLMVSIEKPKSQTIHQVYKNINVVVESVIKTHSNYSCYYYEMNNLLKKNGHSDIDKLRQFIRYKNKHDFRNIPQQKWTNHLEYVKGILNGMVDKKTPITHEEVRECIMALWRHYSTDWGGFWSTIQPNGTLYSVLDPEDVQFIIKHLRDKKKHITFLSEGMEKYNLIK